MTSSTSDTLLVAAQKLAQIAGLPWAHVQPIYRALQQPGGEMNTPWLPKSSGRAVWMAHPNYITRLLIALACGGGAAQAHHSIEWAINTTPGGRAFRLDEKPAANIVPPIELEFFPYLVDHGPAADLVNVEFRQDENRIVFNTRSKGEIVFAQHFASGEGVTDEAQPFRGIYSRGVIHGAVFMMIANIIAWRRADEAPVDFNAPEEPGE